MQHIILQSLIDRIKVTNYEIEQTSTKNKAGKKIEEA